MTKSVLYLLFIFILMTNCARKPIGTFNKSTLPNQPNYEQEKYWAALPDREDAADIIFDPSLEDVQENAPVDVFFLHPTTYTGKKGERNWNASVEDSELNQRTDESTIKYQASTFNGVGKVYAPRYRQIQLQVFDEFEGEKQKSAQQATQVAYNDVKAAFEYYLKHYNNGRPIIIAAHSQGAMLGKELLKDYFDGKDLHKQLVTAYLVGMPVDKDFFEQIKICESGNQIACFTTWRTFQKNHIPKNVLLGNSIAVTNPLTWTSETTYAANTLNKGVIITDKHPFYNNVADAQINKELGILWMTRPKSPLRLLLFPSKNFHIGDINLYYANIRENAKQRVAAFLAKTQ